MAIAHGEGAGDLLAQTTDGSVAEDAATFLDRAEATITDAYKNGLGTEFSALEALAWQVANSDIDLPRRIKVVLDAARVAYLAGQPFSGRKLAERSYQMALANGNPEMVFDAQLLVGICACDVGNVADAWLAYDEALSLARNLKDTVREMRVWHNLGTSLQMAGLYADAILCYKRIESVTDFVPPRATVAARFANIGFCYLEMGEYHSALKATRQSLELLSEPSDAQESFNRCLTDANMTRILARVGDSAGAATHAARSRHYATQSGLPRGDVYASGAEGIALAACGDFAGGIKVLESALESALRLRIADLSTVAALTEVYEKAGLHDKALVHVRLMLARQRDLKRAHAMQTVRDLVSAVAPEMSEDDSIGRLAQKEELFEGRVAKVHLAQTRIDYLGGLAMSAELTEDPSGMHLYRVGAMAGLVARACGCDDEQVKAIEIGGRLHDMGKMFVPEPLKRKSERLSRRERSIVEQHTTSGLAMLTSSQDEPWALTGASVMKHHHEWWNGTGFPDGLIGEEIPLAARIVALADVFDSLTHRRPFRMEVTIEVALEQIKALGGRQFDPALTTTFLALVAQLHAEHASLDDLLGRTGSHSNVIQAMLRIKQVIQQPQ